MQLKVHFALAVAFSMVGSAYAVPAGNNGPVNTIFIIEPPDECWLPGDFNKDGCVDAFDMQPILKFWGSTGVTTGWLGGDPNCDGVVDAFDLTDILKCWGQTSSTLPDPLPQTDEAHAPEPTTPILLTIAGIALTRRYLAYRV